MIDIKYYENGTLKIKSVQEDDSSFRYRAIMGDDNITLKFTLAEAIEFPVGTFVEFQGSTYTLTSPENWSRYGNQNIEYTMLLNGVSATLGKYKLRNLQDNRLKFSMCTTPSEFLDLIVDNLNQSGRSSGWTAQCVIDVSEQKTIEFNHTYLIDALKSIADTFKTEYEITSSKVIKLGKVEYNKAHPLPLAYGAGNGFKAGTGRANSNESKPVEILYVQGGERNIDRSKYGSAELHLPKGQTLEYEGRTYISDEDGLSIRRYGVEPKYGNEDSFDGTEIYPKRIGTVSAVTVVDADAHFYDFADNSIPNDLDYNDVLIDGETMTVIFQTGMLAGREFEISKYTHNGRIFEIVPQEIDGIQMPDNTWKPVVGDTYIIYGCTLPDTYIANDDTKTGAEWDLFREAARNMYENEDFKFTFSGELQGKWAKENWDNVGGKLIIGGYIQFSDTHFAPQGIDIRITGIKEFLGDPYSPIIEISNSIVSAGAFESVLREASNQDVKIGEVLSNSLSFTKRRFRDAQEAINMLEAAFGDKFSKGINPVSIQTMAMLVGDERLQFKVYDISFTSIIAFPATFSNGTLSIEACGIRHFSLGITDTAITTSRSEDSYKKWTLQAQQLTPSDAASAYYLYAKVSRTSSSSASFELSTEVKTIDGTSGYYYLLVGVLSSMSDDGTRSLAPLFGYTEILPNQILTSSVRSANGDTILDLETGVLSLNSNSSNSEQGAGINGRLALSPIAAWFGGPMVDHELTPTATDYAKSLFRFDGTGYLAKGNITWDANGYGQVGGSGDRYAIKWNDNGIFLGSGIKITESGQETLATLLEAVTELQSWFGKDDSGDIYIKNDDNGRPRGFYSNSFISSGGKSDTPGAGGGTVVGANIDGVEVPLLDGILAFPAYPTAVSLGLGNIAFKDSLTIADVANLQSTLDGIRTLAEEGHTANEGLTIVSVTLQSLQEQIDSVANRNNFDEINASAVFADNLSARRVLTGEFIQIGNAVISWDAEHDCLKVDKGLYSTSFLSSAGFSDTQGTGGGTVVGATVGGKEVTLSGGILEFDAYPTTTSLGLKALAFKDALAVNDIPTLDISKISGLQSSLDAISDSLSAHTGNTTVHITASERTAWNAKWDYNEATIKAVKVNAATNADYATSDASGENIAGNFTKVSAAIQSLQSQIDSVASKQTSDEVMAAVVSTDIATAKNAYISVVHGSLDGNAATATNATYSAYDNSGEHIADNFSKVGVALQSLQAQIDSVASRDYAELGETLLSLKLWIEDMFTLTSSGIRTKYNFYTEGNLASGKA